MKKAFICSAYRGDIPSNVIKAQFYCKQLALKGYCVFAPHLFYTQFLNDNIEAERNIGIASGLEIIKFFDELHVFGKITEGMEKEIDFAKENKIKIVYNDRN